MSTETLPTSAVFTAAVTLAQADAEHFDLAFTAVTQPCPWPKAYGGDMVAQAAAAAMRSVAAGKTLNSMHSYFLRPVDIGASIRYEVELLRDGRGYSTRQVRGYQNGKPVYACLASFAAGEPGGTFQTELAEAVPGPEELPGAQAYLEGRSGGTMTGESKAYWAGGRSFDMRHVPGPVYLDVEGGRVPHQAVWLKPFDPLRPVEGLTDAQRDLAALAYVCDYTILEPVLRVLGLPWAKPGLTTASLDHAMWFHRPGPVSDWLLYAQEAVAAEAGRGLCTGRFFTRDRRHLATVVQEGMIRTALPPPTPLRRNPMKIAIVGGGPGGLYFAALMKQLDPAHDITIWERNAPDDTFGFGVVFSDETLGGIENADTEFATAMASRFARWTDIDIHFGGESYTAGGQGFAAMSRKELLSLLQERVRDLGVTVHFLTEAPATEDLRASYDLVIGADGLNSRVRVTYADVFRPSLDRRNNKYMWLGTDRVFEAFQFFVKQTEWGTMQVHGYPYSASGSTFIVEMHEDVWRRAGFDATEGTEFPPGISDEQSVARIRELFADELAGHKVFANNSKWLNFVTVRNERWHHGNIALVGDAAHTAHFSIGSGTKLAMEDSLALAACLHEHPDIESALSAYEAERRQVVESTQRAAQASLEWFENIGMYVRQEPVQFCFNLLTRSRRITFENLRTRDPDFAARVNAAFAASAELQDDVPAMFQPFRLGQLELKNRVIVSPMDMYSSVDGVPGDFHLVHLGSRAMGGAGLVMTEMTCVSPEGRITPGCAGLWTDEQRDAWARVVSFVHERSTARIGLQLGHSGRKGSTRLMWEGMDDPLPEGNWEIVGPSPLPYGSGSAVPRELTRSEMDQITADFAAAARRGADAGFDLLELHCAHGYLLSSFLSPVSNRRTDEYGGSLENRLRFPLEVFDAIRAVWPAERPAIVRISASDWVPGGNTEHDAVEIARAFISHGADGIDVSSGQVTKDERPAFGRSYQTPFADRIRQEAAAEAGAAVIAVGAIASYDDVNSILLAGRADLCAIGRVHLYDPHWTLHAAAEQDFRGTSAQWPLQFKAGRRKPPSARTDAVRPRLALFQEGEPDRAVHLRWKPSCAPAPVS